MAQTSRTSRTECPPPHDLDAEESVLGAIMLGPDVVLDKVRPLLRADDFYRASHGVIFVAAVALADRGEPADAITVTDELRREGLLDAAGGAERVHELASIVPAASNAAHYARIVRREADRRRQRAAFSVQVAAIDSGLPIDRDAVRAVLDGESDGSFVGLSHIEAMTCELPEQAWLVHGLVAAGVIGQIVGLPEAGKSLLALDLALAVASGGGFHEHAVEQGAVGVWLQDGSYNSAMRRVQRLGEGFGDVPIRWYPTQNLRLPDNIAALRGEVERHAQRLVVLDSLYNFLPLDAKLREEDAAAILDRIKTDVCDRTGATVLVVDHSPWPSEGRTQHRAFGSVFKQALHRFTLHVERGKGGEVTVTGKGNDIATTVFTLALHDGRLVPAEEAAVPGRDLDAEVLAYLRDHGPETPTKIALADGIHVGRPKVEAALDRLADAGAVRLSVPPPGRRPGNFFTLAERCLPDPSDNLGQAGAGTSSRLLSTTPSPPVGGRGPDKHAAGTCPEAPDNNGHGAVEDEAA